MLDITDTSRAYITRRGDRVVIHEVVRKNALGNEVTFPVKGTVINRENPRSKRYEIFTLEGRARVLKEHDNDIVGLWHQQGAAQ